MNLFKKSLIGIFVFVILGTIIPLFSVSAASLSGFKFHTGSTNNTAYPPTSNYLQYPSMYIEATISFTQADITNNNCVTVEATSDIEYRPYEPLRLPYETITQVCASNPTNLRIRGGFFTTEAAYADFYKQHTARIRYKVNSGDWITSQSFNWTTNNPFNIQITATTPVLTGSTVPVSVTYQTNGTHPDQLDPSCSMSNSNGANLNPSWYVSPYSFSITPTAPEPHTIWVKCYDTVGYKLVSKPIDFIPVVTISANPPAITSGNSTTISWDSDRDSDTCVMTNFGTTYNSSPQTLYPITNSTYTATCTRNSSYGGTLEKSANVTVTVGAPSFNVELSKNKALVKALSNDYIGTVDLGVTISGLPTGKSCSLYNVNDPDIPVLLHTYNTNINTTIPFNNLLSTNNYQIICNDPTNKESVVQTIRGQSGALDVASCTILENASSCTPQTISWTTVNPDTGSPTAIFQNGLQIIQTTNNGNQSIVLNGNGITNGATSKTETFESKNRVDGETTGSSVPNLLDTKTVIVSCALGSTWNGSICASTATVPTITTVNPATNITATSAKGSGTIVSNGGSDVTVSGITWSKLPIQTNRNPNTILSENKTTSGWAIGGPWTPLHNMSPLDPNTTYYYRAYAINGVGYAYGNQVTFTTLADTTNVMFGSLTGSPNPCIIAQGSSTCNTNLTWTINNIESTLSKITANGMTDITLNTPTIGNDYGATINNVTVTYPSRTFYLYNNNKSLVPVSPAGAGRVVDAQCIAGTSWNGTICAPLPTSGTLTATNCQIPLGGNSCNTTLNWTTTNPIAGVNSAITSNYPFNNTQVFTGNNGTNQIATVPYSSRAFSLYHNGVQLASATPSALCTFGTAWNPTSQTCVSSVTYTVTASAGANGTISPSTRTVNAGATTTFTVTPNSGYTATIGGTCPRGGFVGTTYTTGPITTNCTVTATFSIGLATGVLTIDPLSCDIAQNASTCTVTGATWTTTNATQPSLVDVNTGTVLSTLANNNNPLTVWVAYPQTDFALKHTGFPGILDTEKVTAKCVKDTEWDGSKCIATSGGLSGSVTASDCTISEGESTCSSNISWNTLNPITGHNSEVTTPVNITVGSGNDGDKSYDIRHGDTYFFLSHNSIELGQDMARAVCESGTTWNGTVCVADGGGGITDGDCGNEVDTCDAGSLIQLDDSPTTYIWQCSGINGGDPSPICTKDINLGGGAINIDFKASPKRIFKGRSSTLTWTTDADSCTGTASDGSPFVTDGKPNGTYVVKPNQTTTYTLSCKKFGVSDASQDAEVKVSVIKFFEI